MPEVLTGQSVARFPPVPVNQRVAGSSPASGASKTPQKQRQHNGLGARLGRCCFWCLLAVWGGFCGGWHTSGTQDAGAKSFGFGHV